ncbi:NEDD8-activating enzyme E1 regulatory subunit, partial [Zancudomyces culisetae]
MITVEKVGVKCTKRRIPLINCQTNGFFGFSKSFIPEHCVIESHSEEIDDLRICDPFAELSEYVDSVDLSALDEMEHSHVPYLVLLIKFIAEWKSKNGGNIPQTFKQKKEFAAQIKEAKGTFDRQNYEEAENNVLRLITEYKIPEHI